MSAEVVAAVTLIQAIWPRAAATWGPDTVRAYANLLNDLDPAAALAAVESLATTEDWPPSIAAVRRAALRDRLAPLPWRALREAEGYADSRCETKVHPATAAALEGAMDWSEHGRHYVDGELFLRNYAGAKAEYDRLELQVGGNPDRLPAAVNVPAIEEG